MSALVPKETRAQRELQKPGIEQVGPQIEVETDTQIIRPITLGAGDSLIAGGGRFAATARITEGKDTA